MRKFVLLAVVGLALPGASLLGLCLTTPKDTGLFLVKVCFAPFFGCCVAASVPLKVLYSRSQHNRGFTWHMTGAWLAFSLPFSVAITMANTDLLQLLSFPALYVALPIEIYGLACVYAQFCALARCKLRSLAWRLIVSWPSSIVFSSVAWLALLLPPLSVAPAPTRFLSVVASLCLSQLGLLQTLHSRSPLLHVALLPMY